MMHAFTRKKSGSLGPAGTMLVGLLVFGLAACNDDEVAAPESPDNLPTVVSNASSLGTLEAALGAAGLVEALEAEGPFTVFAPRDAAFEALGADVVDALLASGNEALLQKVLTYHVVPSARLEAADLRDGQLVSTLQGDLLEIGISNGTVTVNGATVVQADVEASNGIAHVIDGVLVPETNIVERAILTPQTQTLVDAVVAGDLAGTLSGPGPFTVFAPVNAAFEALGTETLDALLDPANQALLQKILTYHVIPGEIRAADLTDGASVTTVEGTPVTIDLSGSAPMVNGAEIIATDIETSNGVIHLIDTVLTDNADIVDVAVLNRFDTLVDLVAEAGLVETLRSDNGGAGFTVFAPTEDAFAALSSVPSGQALVDVLTYHVVGATVESGDLSDGQVVTTVQGGTFTVNISGSSVTITDGAGNTVNVILTDVPAANGIVHVVDAVLLPS